VRGFFKQLRLKLKPVYCLQKRVKSTFEHQLLAALDPGEVTNLYFTLLAKKSHLAIQEYRYTDDLAEDFMWPQ